MSSLVNSGVKIMTRTTVFGLYDNCVAGLLERVTDHHYSKPEYMPRQRFWTIRAKHVILSTGAFERHIAFNNNDVPGVMNVNAAKHYLNRYGVLTGKDIMILFMKLLYNYLMLALMLILLIHVNLWGKKLLKN